MKRSVSVADLEKLGQLSFKNEEAWSKYWREERGHTGESIQPKHEPSRLELRAKGKCALTRVLGENKSWNKINEAKREYDQFLADLVRRSGGERKS